MVRHQHVQASGADRAEPADALDLLDRDPALLPARGARGVEAEHREPVVEMGRRQVVGDQLPVAVQRAEDAPHDVVERDVVVARHRQPGRGQPVEEAPGGLELRAPGALREVAGDDHQGRGSGGQVREHRLLEGGVDTPEVQVGEVREDVRRHQRSGASTRSARGRTRYASGGRSS
jgi:hypothetical protein